MDLGDLDLQSIDSGKGQHLAESGSPAKNWIKEHQGSCELHQTPMIHKNDLRTESAIWRENTHDHSWYCIDPRNDVRHGTQGVIVASEHQRYQEYGGDVYHAGLGIVGRNRKTGQILRVTGPATGQHGGMIMYEESPASKPMGKRGKSQKLTCGVCMKRLTTTTTLRNHMKMHTGNRDEKCGRCMKGFISKANRKAHEKICKIVIRPKKKWELMYQSTQRN